MDEDSRKKMDNFLREIEGQFPAKVMINCSQSVNMESEEMIIAVVSCIKAIAK